MEIENHRPGLLHIFGAVEEHIHPLPALSGHDKPLTYRVFPPLLLPFCPSGRLHNFKFDAHISCPHSSIQLIYNAMQHRINFQNGLLGHANHLHDFPGCAPSDRRHKPFYRIPPLLGYRFNPGIHGGQGILGLRALPAEMCQGAVHRQHRGGVAIFADGPD